MRSVRHSDVIAAARVIIAVPKQTRAQVCARLLQHADLADRYTRKMGKPHPLWGCGTLLGAASCWPKLAEPTFDNAAYRAAFMMVLEQVNARKAQELLVS